MIEKRDVSAMMRSVAQVVREYVQGVKDALAPRIEGLERSVAVLQERKPEKGEPGLPGKDGQDGKDGKDGERGVQGASIQGPSGERGERGMDGKDGKDGAPGPQGERGLPGESIQGPKGEAGERGERGVDGKDAVLPDIAGMIERAMTAQVDRWALDFERRAHERFEFVIDRMPKPKDGKDGRDAFELEDLSVEHDGDGNVTLTFKRGELVRTFTLRIPRFKDRGVFREGTEYISGDGISYGNSFWISQKDGPSGKPGSSDDWRLAVRKGSDGRDLRPGDRKVNETVKLHD